MPKLRPETRKIREKRFLSALEKTGSPKLAALEVLNIGSKGSKDLQNSASAAGAQMLERIRPSMVDALERKGITVDKIADRTNTLLDSEEPIHIDKGITQVMKMGLGGGYAAEKSVNTNVNINATPEDIDKFRKLREEYEQKLLNEISE